MELLLDKKADVNAGIKKSFTFPLFEAASAGNLDIVKLLISRNAFVNGQNTFGSSALHAACSKFHLEMVYFLIESGADLYATNKVIKILSQPFYQ